MKALDRMDLEELEKHYKELVEGHTIYLIALQEVELEMAEVESLIAKAKQ